jgi:SprT protein
MLSDQLKLQAQNKLHILFNDAIRHPHVREFNKTLLCPELMFVQRGKIAASARLQTNVINVNPQLFVDNVQYFLDTIFAHELAHIFVHQCYTNKGRAKRVKPHGIEWQRMMLEVFALPADVTHNLDVSKVKRKGYMYACECGEVELSAIRHNRVQRGEQQYRCRKCHTTLVIINNC